MKLMWVIIGAVLLVVGGALAMAPTIMGKSIADNTADVEDEFGDNASSEDLDGETWWIKATVIEVESYNDLGAEGDDLWLIYFADDGVDELADCGDDDCFFAISDQELEKDDSGVFTITMEEPDFDCTFAGTDCFDEPAPVLTRSNSQNTMFFVIPGAVLAVVGLLLGVLFGFMLKQD